MKLLLIAGHGAGDPGAVATFSGRQYREANETRTLASMVKKLLDTAVETELFPTEKNAYTEVMAGRALPRADIVLELHFNAFSPDGGDGRTKGVECYIPTEEKNTRAAENLCKGISALGFTNRGVKRKNYAVIRRAKEAGAHALLLEVCFLDDADDMALYEMYRDKVAQAIFRGVVSAFGLLARQEPTAEEARRIVQEKAGLEDKTMDYLARYTYGEDLLKKLAKAIKYGGTV